MFVWVIPSCAPLLYSKNGVYRGLQGFSVFLIFALKHRSWVLVRTASLVPTIYVYNKNENNITIFASEQYHSYSRDILIYYIGMFA